MTKMINTETKTSKMVRNPKKMWRENIKLHDARININKFIIFVFGIGFDPAAKGPY